MSAPTTSTVAAVKAKFAALIAANFPGGVVPDLYFGEVQSTDAAGAQVQPTTRGYVVLKVRGEKTAPLGFPTAFGMPARESADIEFEIFYPTVADCDAAALAIKRNGGPTAQRAGFDYGSLPALAAPRRVLAVRRTGETPAVAGVGQTGDRVHTLRLSYRVETVEDA